MRERIAEILPELWMRTVGDPRATVKNRQRVESPRRFVRYVLKGDLLSGAVPLRPVALLREWVRATAGVRLSGRVGSLWGGMAKWRRPRRLSPAYRAYLAECVARREARRAQGLPVSEPLGPIRSRNLTASALREAVARMRGEWGPISPWTDMDEYFRLCARLAPA